MSTELGLAVKKQVLKKIKDKYKKVQKKDKSKIIDHIIDLTGYDRKYAIHQLNRDEITLERKKRVVNSLKYTSHLKEQLIKIWYASNKICSKRLAPFLSEMMEALERKNRINLTEAQRCLMKKISPSTIDRLLRSERKKLGKKGRSNTNSSSLLKHSIKIKTFNCKTDPEPGHFEADLVAHCGGNCAGQFLNTLVMTDMHSQWTEFFPLISKSSEEVISALIEAKQRVPLPILGFDTDNGSEFINHALVSFCNDNMIRFTRSRPYKKNDQAHVEEKNGSIIRKIVGYDRFEGLSAETALSELYQVLRLYINYFQPSLKLESKSRDGGKVTKRYDKAKTPYRRIMNSIVDQSIKDRVTKEYNELDPVALLAQIQELQEKFWKHAWEKQQHAQKEYNALLQGINSDLQEAKSTLENIKKEKEAKVSELKSIELKTYHSAKHTKKKIERTWRTREDCFKDVWKEDIEPMLEKGRSSALDVMNELIKKYPDKFQIGQLRTLQRQSTKWRKEIREKKKLDATKNNILFDTKASSAKGVIDNNLTEHYS
jgi:hypothetical protein